MNAHTPLRRRERDRGAQQEPKARKPTAHQTTATETDRAGATWTAERVAQLKSCVGIGLTCSQIAAEIGVTRNAVIGKMNRLGISRPRSLAAPASERQRGAWRPKSDNVTKLFGQHRIVMRLPFAPLVAPETIRNGRGCSLLELGAQSCRWPINEPGAADFCFCGNPQVEGLPYCVGHARIAYKSSSRASARV